MDMKIEWGFEQGIFWQIMRPKTASKIDAVVVGYHGYGDHSDFGMQWHAQEVLKMNQPSEDRNPSIAFVLFDQPGAGRSDGLWGYVPDWFEHVEKCRKFLDFVKEQKFPGIPIYGFGFSCGGGILVSMEAMHSMKHQSPLFAGLVLLAPMLAIEPSMKPPPFVQLLLRFAVKLCPTWPVVMSAYSGELSYRDPSWHMKSRLMNKLQYCGYPRLATAQSFLQAVEWMPSVFENISTPYILLHGTADFVTCIKGSRKFHVSNNSKIKKFLVLEGYRHHILGPGQEEEHNEKPYKEIRAWLKEMVASGLH